MNLQGMFDEFESAAIAFDTLTLYQRQLKQPDVAVEKCRREAAQSVIDLAHELMSKMSDDLKSLT